MPSVVFHQEWYKRLPWREEAFEQKEMFCILLINTALNINPLKTKRRLLYLKTQSVRRSKHFSFRL